MFNSQSFNNHDGLELRLTERNNKDTKKFKIVHPFDGRVMDLQHSILERCALELSKCLNFEDVDYVIGFAEGGLIPAYAVAKVMNIPFKGSYRVRLHELNEISFIEPHSMRAEHYVYGIESGSKVVIIEDEITTGRTLKSAILAFIAKGIIVNDIGTYILSDDYKEDSSILELGLKIKRLYDFHGSQ